MKQTILSLLARIRKYYTLKAVRYGARTVAVLFLIVAAGPWLANAAAQQLFNNKQYPVAEKIWIMGAAISLQERDIMYANAGNSLYKQDKLADAVDKYEHAIDTAPEKRQCKIRWNAAQALTRIGERQESEAPSDAIGSYSRAIFLLTYEPCLNDSEVTGKIDELQGRVERLSQRLREKQQSTDYKPDFEEPDDEERTVQQRKQAVEYNKQGSSDKYYNQSVEEKADQTVVW